MANFRVRVRNTATSFLTLTPSGRYRNEEHFPRLPAPRKGGVLMVRCCCISRKKGALIVGRTPTSWRMHVLRAWRSAGKTRPVDWIENPSQPRDSTARHLIVHAPAGKFSKKSKATVRWPGRPHVPGHSKRTTSKSRAAPRVSGPWPRSEPLTNTDRAKAVTWAAVIGR